MDNVPFVEVFQCLKQLEHYVSSISLDKWAMALEAIEELCTHAAKPT